MSYYPNYQQPMYPQPVPDYLAQVRQNYQMQPTMQQMPAQPALQQIWVPSEAVARNYLVAPNSSVTMWNENLPEVYLKKADASGRTEFEAYDLVKREAPTQQAGKPEDEVITLRKLMAVLANLGLIQAKSNKDDKEDVNNG